MAGRLIKIDEEIVSSAMECSEKGIDGMMCMWLGTIMLQAL